MDVRVALVTGANKGFGFATAQALLNLGMIVYVGSGDAESGHIALDTLSSDGAARLALLHMADENSVLMTLAAIDAAHGRLDVLVNNAGIALDSASAVDAAANIVRCTFETNVHAPAGLIQLAVPLLRKSSGSRVVNVSSGVGSPAFFADPHAPAMGKIYAYSLSKVALNGVTTLFADALRADRIKVNSASPGVVKTDLSHQMGSPPSPTPLARDHLGVGAFGSGGWIATLDQLPFTWAPSVPLRSPARAPRCSRTLSSKAGASTGAVGYPRTVRSMALLPVAPRAGCSPRSRPALRMPTSFFGSTRIVQASHGLRRGAGNAAMSKRSRSRSTTGQLRTGEVPGTVYLLRGVIYLATTASSRTVSCTFSALGDLFEEYWPRGLRVGAEIPSSLIQATKLRSQARQEEAGMITRYTLMLGRVSHRRCRPSCLSTIGYEN